MKSKILFLCIFTISVFLRNSEVYAQTSEFSTPLRLVWDPVKLQYDVYMIATEGSVATDPEPVWNSGQLSIGIVFPQSYDNTGACIRHTENALALPNYAGRDNATMFWELDTRESVFDTQGKDWWLAINNGTGDDYDMPVGKNLKLFSFKACPDATCDPSIRLWEKGLGPNTHNDPPVLGDDLDVGTGFWNAYIINTYSYAVYSGNGPCPATIEPTDDAGSVTTAGGVAVVDITKNDKINGAPVDLKIPTGTDKEANSFEKGNPGMVSICSSSPWPAGITLNTTTGAVNVAAGTATGVYNLCYTLCDTKTYPSTLCKDAQVVVTVDCPPIAAPVATVPVAVCPGVPTTLDGTCTAGTFTLYSDVSLTTTVSSPVSPMKTTTYYGACVNGTCKSSGTPLKVSVKPCLVDDTGIGAVGNPITGNLTPGDKLPDGSTYKAPKVDSSNPNPNTTDVPVINPNGTYTFTGSVPGVFTFLVPVCNADAAPDQICVDQKLTITVGCPTLTAPVVTAPAAVCPSVPTTLDGTCTAGTFTLYSDVSLTTTVSSPVSPAVTTTYQAACVNGTCKSPATPLKVSVKPCLVDDTNSGNTGTPISGALKPNDNVPTGSKYGPDSTPDGSNPNTNKPTINPDGTYTFTSSVPGVFKFTVPVCNADTPVLCENQLLTITVGCPTLTAPVATAPAAVCPSVATTLTGSCTAGTFTLYSDASLTTTVANPVNPAVTTTYQAACVNGTCKSPATPLKVSVKPCLVDDTNSGNTDTPISGALKPNDNVPTGSKYGPDSTPDGSNPNTNKPTINPDGTYTFTSSVPGVFKFTVPVCNADTPVLCENQLLTITVGCPTLTAPVATAPAAVCPSVATTLTGSCTAGTFTLYSDASLTTTVANPVSPAVTTTYQAACVNGTCKSPATPLKVSVKPCLVDDTNSGNTDTPIAGALKPNDNVPTGSKYGPDSTPDGSNPNTNKPTINPDGTYTFTSNVSGVFKFTVPVCNADTPALCENQILTITVGCTPMTGPSIVTFGTVCPGTGGIPTGGCTVGTFTLYRDAELTNPFPMESVAMQQILVTTTYYAACVNGTCKSSGTPVKVLVKPCLVDDTKSGKTGEEITGDLKPDDKLPTGSTYGTPTPDQSNPNQTDKPVIKPDGTYTFTSNVPGVFKFTVPVCNADTPDPICEKQILTITVGCPTVEAPSVTTPTPVCAGKPVTLQGSCSTSMTISWFSDQALTTTVASMVTPTATTTYYAACKNAAGCLSPGVAVTATVTGPCSSSISLRAKAFLLGDWLLPSGNNGFDNTNVLMHNLMLQKGKVPTKEPYTGMSTFTHIGGGNETTTALGANGGTANAIVDWVFVELRSDPSTVIATRSGLIQRDGDIVDVDGVSALTFANVTPTTSGTYYVSVRHRNHLGIMNANPIPLSNITADAPQIDFTQPSTVVYQKTGTSKRIAQATVAFSSGSRSFIWGGDVNLNKLTAASGGSSDIGTIYEALSSESPNILKPGYDKLDVNMNGEYHAQGNINDTAPIAYELIKVYTSTAGTDGSILLLLYSQLP